MDTLIEKVIGDAHVSIRKGGDSSDAARQIKMAAAFPATGKTDSNAVDAFLHPLRDIGSINLDVLLNRMPTTALPAGYRHFRLFNAETGELWHHSFVIEEGRVLSIRHVVFGTLNHPLLELESWITTEWMPDAIPGVLDLEICFVAGPRTKPFRLRP